MKRITTGIAVLAMALVPLAGCGGDDSEPAAAASTPAPATAPAAATATTVKMVDNAFEAKDITIEVGDTVKWENTGQLPHTATATEGADFDSGTVAPGESFEWTAKKAGAVSYLCSFHPGMVGTITVR
jgi:plastocyanin